MVTLQSFQNEITEDSFLFVEEYTFNHEIMNNMKEKMSFNFVHFQHVLFQTEVCFFPSGLAPELLTSDALIYLLAFYIYVLATPNVLVICSVPAHFDFSQMSPLHLYGP